MTRTLFVVNAPVTIAFALLCLLVWGLSSWGLLGSEYGFFVLSGANFDVSSPISYLSIILYPFMHSSLDHLMNNMMYILLLGPILEERYGSRTFLAMMVSTSLIVAVAFIVVKGAPITGSSALAFMMIILSSFTHFHLKRIPITFVLIFALYIVREMIGFGSVDNIARVGHIVGGLCGAGFGLYQIGREKGKVREAEYDRY